MSLSRAIRRLRNKKGEAASKKKRKALLEPLEPRVLLSADLSYTMTGGAKDLTLQLDQVVGVDMIQLVNNEDLDPLTQVVASAALSETSTVEILGSDQDDILRLDFDFTPLEESLSILFQGGAGNDSLTGPSTDTIWNITGEDSGLVAGVHFADVERLLGAAENEDTFVFTEGGSQSGQIDGGAGGFDTLVLDGNYDKLIFTPTGPDAGTVNFDGNLVTYAGLEPVLVNSGTPTAVIFNMTSGNDAATLSSDGTNLSISASTFETTSIAITSLASYTIDGQGGIDSVTVTSDLSMAGIDLIINAESISVNSGETITADDITLTATSTGTTGFGALIDNLLKLIFDDTEAFVGNASASSLSDLPPPET